MPATPELLNIADEFVTRPAREHPQKTAIVGVERQATYAEIEKEMNRVAQALREYGCQPRDRLLIVLPDSLEFIATFFGAAKIGALPVPVNSMARAHDYQHYLANSGARFAIVHDSSFEEFKSALHESAVEYMIIVGAKARAAGTGQRTTIAWDDWRPQNVGDVATQPTGADDPAFLLYTSGSGGSPRAAVHRHRGMVATSTAYARGVLGLRPDDITFSVSKLFFAYGLGAGMYFPLSAGASTVLFPERPRADLIAQAVRRHRPTVFFSVPTFYAALLREADSGGAMDFSSVRMAVSAGEALPAEIFARFRDRFGIDILDGLGSTEMLHMYMSARPGKTRPGSCGQPVPGYRVKILDDQEREVPDGEIGSLWVCGPSGFIEYWNAPEISRTRMSGEWYLTGDKLTRDSEGYLHYCGRADDMMKVSGMWVSPVEVENALLGHPAVAECAVVGQFDAVGLTRPVAYIVLRRGVQQPGGAMDSEISAWLRTRLVGYKCPEEFKFVAELPKTATGKIQRFRLRARADRNSAGNT
ncbi:MAG TPA: benzoate-CoA ligase family protein [Candidatus Limnocylindria bacterium]|nr:benzoate-CoA ligase family protein [Candidatus Limnocylindria bacterium]